MESTKSTQKGGDRVSNVLEIGCGVRRRPEATVTIDKTSYGKPDIVRDVAKRGIPFADNTFDAVYAMDVMEHIEKYEDLIFFINEVWRVLLPNGIYNFTTPYGVAGLYEHLTHHRCFTEMTFKYLEPDLPDDYENMRVSDGIIARFNTKFDRTSSLVGIFTAIK